MAEGRSPFEYGWQAVGLLFLCLTSYYSAVEGIKGKSKYASYASEVIEVEEGEKCLIPCKVNANIDVVLWSALTGRYDDDLVSLDLTVTPPLRSGYGYNSGKFNITDDFTLVINNVRPRDEDFYFCVMRDYARYEGYTNTSFVSVRRKGALQTNTPASPPPVDIRSILQTSGLHAFTSTAPFPTVGLPIGDTSANLSKVHAPSTPKAVDASDLHPRTEFTPTAECPTDVLFKALSGVSVTALVVTWATLICYLLLEERRRANAEAPNEQREREEMLS